MMMCEICDLHHIDGAGGMADFVCSAVTSGRAFFPYLKPRHRVGASFILALLYPAMNIPTPTEA